MSYQIGSYGFVKWEGPPPQLVKQHLQLFTKTGQAGISALSLGVHGDPFIAELTAVFDTQANSQIAENGYRALIGAAPQVITFNGTNYNTAFSHTYLVEMVEVTQSRVFPRLIGPGYDYVHGWQLRSRWQLVPIV